ncbi:anti-sigma factor family protein [Heyndrickxia acidiproducens]|uniref:anti-sigma factor family protein n=1 Tax=Heyndrickxia acidiproducens TaxID=1121084 RepID=UPI00037FD39C|nr:zf-HC2 domain-containing protein [Heyndrickxia acidiproducens]
MDEHVEDLLSAFIDHELNKKERQKVESHLSVCPACRKELEQLRAVKTEFISFYHHIEPPDFHFEKAVKAKISQQENRLEMNYHGLIWFFTLCVLAAGFTMYFVLRTPFYVGVNIASALVNICASSFHIALSIFSAIPSLFAIIAIAASVMLAICLWLVLNLLKMKPLKE